MIVYKGYDEKQGWTRDYKREDGKLLFNFGNKYVKCNDYCVGFELLDDGDERSVQIQRENKIADVLDEDGSLGFLFTKSLYKYSGIVKISYKKLKDPYFILDYRKGVFYLNYFYSERCDSIPISYLNEFNERLIELDDLEYVCNKVQNPKLVNELFYGRS